MTRKQIDSMRETRLWMSQIIVPAITIIFAIPESRESVINGFKEAKYSINRKWTKFRNRK